MPKVRELNKAYRIRVRNEVLDHYGSICACCGEAQREFLTLDHINEDGKKHRIEVMGRNVGGWKFYLEMRKLGYPEGLQVLCWNCNRATWTYRTCPHKWS